jgi:two-component system chemotaxis sensor kinase CheA
MDDAAATALVFESELSTSAMLTQVSGRGLGLAIVREMGRRMGGELEVDSDGARATRFVLTLHLAHAPADPPRDRVSA